MYSINFDIVKNGDKSEKYSIVVLKTPMNGYDEYDYIGLCYTTYLLKSVDIDLNHIAGDCKTIEDFVTHVLEYYDNQGIKDSCAEVLAESNLSMVQSIVEGRSVLIDTILHDGIDACSEEDSKLINDYEAYIAEDIKIHLENWYKYQNIDEDKCTDVFVFKNHPKDDKDICLTGTSQFINIYMKDIDPEFADSNESIDVYVGDKMLQRLILMMSCTARSRRIVDLLCKQDKD